jgi:hypothetical protein
MLCELGLLFVMHFHVTFLHALVQGELALVQGELLCEFLARDLMCLWWYLLFVRVCFCLSCVEPLPLPKGTEVFLLQVILLFAFPLAFDRLLKFL